VRGASALQSVLETHPDPTVRVLVVWESVIPSDIAPPSTATLSRMRDPRVAQYWDPDLSLSRDIVRALRADPSRYGIDWDVPEDFVAWDLVALFPPGTLWGDDLPVPSYYGGPLVDVMDELLEALRNEASVRPAHGHPEPDEPVLGRVGEADARRAVEL
jgi:hypothetical protein